MYFTIMANIWCVPNLKNSGHGIHYLSKVHSRHTLVAGKLRRYLIHFLNFCILFAHIPVQNNITILSDTSFLFFLMV